MQAQLTAAKAALNNLNAAMPAYAMAVDARELAFAPLDKLITRVVNLYKVSVTNKAEAETAMSLQRKINGRRAPGRTEAAATTDADGQPKRKHSISQRSYDMRSELFDQLIRVVSANMAYAPNEADLKPAALNTLLADLRSKSQAVTVAEIVLSNARLTRDKLLYALGSGLVDTATDSRNYVRALYGATSPVVKQLSGYKFKKQVA